MTNGWPDAERPGVPINPERDAFHWIRRKGSQWHEAWRWDPDADGCGTEYSGAWAEADGDGVPLEMARWYEYAGPCLTPAEVAALVEAARREEREACAALCEEGASLCPDDQDFNVGFANGCLDSARSIRARGAA